MIQLSTLLLLGSALALKPIANAAPSLSRSDVISIKMSNHAMRPEKLVVVYSTDNEGQDYINSPKDYVQALANVLIDINKTKKSPIELVLVSNQRDEARAEDFARKHEFVHELVVLKDLDRDFWAQDIGEFMFARTKNSMEYSPFIFDVNRKSGYDLGALGEHLANKWGREWFKLEEESEVNNYGGNIEASPGNILYLGESTSSLLKSFFTEKGYADRIVQMDSHWLEVGHVDEFITTIPLPDDPCGFAIAKANPVWGAQIFREIKEQEFDNLPEKYALIQDWMEPVDFNSLISAREIWTRLQYQMGNKSPWLKHGRPGLTGRDRWFYKPEKMDITQPTMFDETQIFAKKIIDANADRLALKAQAVIPECKHVKMIDLPITYHCGIDNQRLMLCGSDLPNSANLISLGSDNIVPDPFFPTIRKAIKHSFQKINHRVHFIDTMMYQESKGNAHCVTNVVRDANTSVLDWEIQ